MYTTPAKTFTNSTNTLLSPTSIPGGLNPGPDGSLPPYNAQAASQMMPFCFDPTTLDFFASAIPSDSTMPTSDPGVYFLTSEDRDLLNVESLPTGLDPGTANFQFEAFANSMEDNVACDFLTNFMQGPEALHPLVTL